MILFEVSASIKLVTVEHLPAEPHSTVQKPDGPWSPQSAAFPQRTSLPVCTLLGMTTACCTVWFPPPLQGT